MKIFFFIYRDWAFNIVKLIIKKKRYKYFKIFTKYENELSASDIKKYNIKTFNNNFSTFKFLKKEKPDIIFFLGWSNLIDRLIYKKFLCICLHPSMLPNFRGGSPLQNQIIRNQLISGLTLFKMNGFIDGGPIIDQCNLSLIGNISLVLKRIELKGFYLIDNFLKNFNKIKLVFQKQNLKNKKIYKRRKLKDSFFLIDDLKDKSFIFFNNFVNMLSDPYPNAFTIIDNKKIYIQKICKSNNHKLKFLEDIKIKKIKNVNNYLIKLKDNNIKILKSSIS